MSEGDAAPGAPPDGWVPVDERLLGLDKRSLLPGGVVLALAALMLWVLPLVNGSIDWDNPTRAGDELRMTGDIRVTPPVGWNLVDGALVDEGSIRGGSGASTATLLDGGISISISSGSFDGSPADLLRRVEKNSRTLDGAKAFRLDGGRSTVTTASGETGVVEAWRSQASDGLTAAFVLDSDKGKRRGLSVVVRGSDGQIEQHREEIDDLLRSVTVKPKDAA